MTVAMEQPAISAATEHLLPVMSFYAREAELLDGSRFDEWLELLSEDIQYQVPVRAVTKDGEGEYDTGGLRINDTLAHIRARIKRLRTGWAWAEEPPSRVVRCVGSVGVETTERDDLLKSMSAVILHRHRAQGVEPDVMAYRRVDYLRIFDGRYLLNKRTIYMSEDVLLSPNVSIFL